jgi:SAM-dependent methyltransferase
MKTSLLAILACPNCGSDLTCPQLTEKPAPNLLEGELVCSPCRKIFPVRNGIPRFVAEDGYATSFGLQWNIFREEQLDSATGTSHSQSRFFNETGLREETLPGKKILEAGCGAGRFVEIASEYPCEVIGVDISSAVDAAAKTVQGRDNVQFVQASITALPFKKNSFDVCYSIGVMQHTPSPEDSAAALGKYLKKGGRAAVTVYERKPWTLLNAKYLIRPLTRRLPAWFLLPLTRIVVTVLFPFTEILFRLPVLGKLFGFLIPIADYTFAREMSLIQRYRATVLDTFDMLSPAYDHPLNYAELSGALSRSGVSQLRRIPSTGLTVIGDKI